MCILPIINKQSDGIAVAHKWSFILFCFLYRSVFGSLLSLFRSSYAHSSHLRLFLCCFVFAYAATFIIGIFPLHCILVTMHTANCMLCNTPHFGETAELQMRRYDVDAKGSQKMHFPSNVWYERQRAASFEFTLLDWIELILSHKCNSFNLKSCLRIQLHSYSQPSSGPRGRECEREKWMAKHASKPK